MTAIQLGPFDFGRIVNAAQKIEERLLRATAALNAAGVMYAVIGGNAVGNWISRVDDTLVRFTRDVDVLLRRDDLDAAKAALAPAGFTHRHVRGMDVFLDGPESKVGDGVHILFASEKVREDDPVLSPSVEESERGDRYRVLNLEALVRMKLTAHRNKDLGHLDDLIDAKLIDRSWINRFPGVLQRLQLVFDKHVTPLHADD